jgi:large subunit ribosomal protein L23
MKLPHHVILAPVLSEKASKLVDTNVYTFKVAPSSNKHGLKSAFEFLYDVKVDRVWTNVAPGKARKFGKYVGDKKVSKFARFKVADGQKIELFKDL